MTESKRANPIKKIKNQQFRFLKNALAEYEDDDKEVIDDEHWAFEMVALQTKKSSFTVKSSYMDCIGFGLQKYSSKGFNPEIEKLNERLINEHSKTLSDALREHIKQAQNNSRKRTRSEDSSGSEESESDKEEMLEEVPKKKRFMKPE